MSRSEQKFVECDTQSLAAVMSFLDSLFLEPCTQVHGFETPAIWTGSGGAEAEKSDSRGVWHLPNWMHPSSEFGARAQWRRYESCRDRRVRSQRDECRLRFSLARDAACVASHRGGPPIQERPADGLKEASGGLRCDFLLLKKKIVGLRK